MKTIEPDEHLINVFKELTEINEDKLKIYAPSIQISYYASMFIKKSIKNEWEKEDILEAVNNLYSDYNELFNKNVKED